MRIQCSVVIMMIFGGICAQPASALQKQNRSGTSAWEFLSEKYDKDQDGTLTEKEYDRNPEAFARFDTNKDGVLTVADWEQGGARGNRRGGGRKDRGVAPEVGQVAPDFELAYVSDPAKTAKLSSFANDKAVALIFGSCT